MLYPKDCIVEEENNFIDKVKDIKESIITLLKAFRNYSSCTLFFKQKFHF